MRSWPTAFILTLACQAPINHTIEEKTGPTHHGPWGVCVPNDPAQNRIDSLESTLMDMGDVDPLPLRGIIESAIKAEREGISAELILSLAYHESRLKSDARNGKVCGIMQVAPGYSGLHNSVCKRWNTDIDHAMEIAVSGLQSMLDDSRVQGDMTWALRYRSCGNAAFTRKCNKDEWILKVNETINLLNAEQNKR